MMPRRAPFRLIPRVSRSEQMGWTYLRWGRGLWRLDQAPGAWRQLIWGADDHAARPSPRTLVPALVLVAVSWAPVILLVDIIARFW